MLDPPFEQIFSLRTEFLQFSQEFGLIKGFQPVPFINASQFFPDCPNSGAIISK